MKVSNVILTSFFFLLFVFFIVAYQSYRHYEGITEKHRLNDHSVQVVNSCNEFQQTIFTLVNCLQNEFLRGGPSIMKISDSVITKADKILADLTFTIDPESLQQKTLEEIKNRWRYWREEIADPLLRAKRYSTASDSARIAFDNLYKSKFSMSEVSVMQTSLQVKFSKLMKDEFSYHTRAISNLTEGDDQLTFFMPWIIALLVGISISIFITHFLSSRLNKISRIANSLTLGNYKIGSDPPENNEFDAVIHDLQCIGQILESNTCKLKRQREDLDQIVLMVAHDIKTPLRGVSSALSWIEEDQGGELNQMTADYLAIVRTRVARVDGFLEELLKYIRHGAGGAEKEYVHVSALLDDIMEQSVEPRTGILLIKGHDLPLFHTDRLALRQVLANLVANAFKHHDKSQGTVRVYHQRKRDFYEFFVEDDGPGIPLFYRDKIYRVFQTAHSTEGPSGIGLAIVKRILSDRNLEIHLHSEPGKGSTFSFTWPA